MLHLNQDSYIKHHTLPDHLKITDEQFDLLWSCKPDTRASVRIFGKDIIIPRYQLILGHDYHFSGKTHNTTQIEVTNPGHQLLLNLLMYVRQDTEQEYNGILVNFYRDGNDYIGPHSDDTRDLVENSDIYSITFGDCRKFILKNKTSTEKYILLLNNNDVLVMGGACQKYYKHSVPKCKSTRRRINVTIRHFK